MDLSSLEIFRTVVREGGVTRAAQQLNRVQSNVTTRIRQLEASLGVQLFVRESKRMVLTPAGQTLLTYAAAVVKHHRQDRREGEAADAHRHGQRNHARNRYAPGGGPLGMRGGQGWGGRQRVLHGRARMGKSALHRTQGRSS